MGSGGNRLALGWHLGLRIQTGPPNQARQSQEVSVTKIVTKEEKTPKFPEVTVVIEVRVRNLAWTMEHLCR